MLFPEARRALEAAAAETPVWTEGYDIAAAREEARRAAALRSPRGRRRGPRPRRRRRTGPALPPRRRRAPGVVVHLHGGGFVFHDVDVHDRPCRRFANRTGLAVLSVDYRRPPEHRFPAAPDDVDTVLGWLEREARRLGRSAVRPRRQRRRQPRAGRRAAPPGPVPRAVALIYPFLDPTAGFASYRHRAPTGFDPREAAWYWQQYAATPGRPDRPRPRAAALRPARHAAADAGHHRRARPAARRGRAARRAGWPRPACAVDRDPLPRSAPRLLAPPAVFPAAEQLMRQVAGVPRTAAPLTALTG